ncbi:MAG TPA: cbb3-type cytochrome c oxidase subunit I [Bacteroidia bacterium]|nr:cbb3-type cytochrome c oxidase subunit I [Bacteroidia bacterium]
MKIFPGIHLVFGLTGLLIFIPIEIMRHSAFDFNIHDTYFVVSSWHVSMAVFFIFQFFAFIYYGFAKMFRPLGKKLAGLHYGLTTLTIVLFFILPYLMNGLPRRITPEDGMMNSMKTINLLITINALLFVSAQLLFFINVGITIFKKRI